MKKKILFTGIILVLVMLFIGTCGDDLNEDGEIEYTDVLYSADGSQVTIYLDGLKVPVTKAQRAMTRDLAMMAYDYLEVVFLGTGTGAVARAAWELGYPAGISGVTRGDQDYTGVAKACLFAGKKDGKTLFGIGEIIAVDGEPTSSPAVGDGTGYVTFGLRAIQAGLLVAGEVLATNTRGVAANSFDQANGALKSFTGTDGTKYPMYSYPSVSTATTLKKTYTFSMVGNVGNLAAAKMYNKPGALNGPEVQRRVPRFLQGGSYREPKNMVDTKTTVSFDADWSDDIVEDATGAGGTSFNSKVAVGLVFNVKPESNGIFSFYIQIPVYNTTLAANTNTAGEGEVKPTKWFIRTGYGSELYSIDDGSSNGGCTLINIGSQSASDWLGIEWEWLSN